MRAAGPFLVAYLLKHRRTANASLDTLRADIGECTNEQ